MGLLGEIRILEGEGLSPETPDVTSVTGQGTYDPSASGGAALEKRD